MSMTQVQIDELRSRSAEVKKALSARNTPAAAALLKQLTERSTSLHAATTPIMEGEVDGFFSKHMGSHGSDREELVAFQKAADDAYVVAAILGLVKYNSSNEDNGAIVSPRVRSLQTYRTLQKTFPKLCAEGARVAKHMESAPEGFAKALHSTGTALGDEWVPTVHSPRLTEDVHLETKIASLFEKIQMPAATYVLPVMGALPKLKKLSDATTDSPTNITVSNLASTSQLVVSNSFTLSNLSGFLKATAGAVATAAADRY